MEYVPLIFTGIALLVIASRPFTTLLHELGHAIPVMLMTKQGAEVYIGSYGNKKYSFKLTLGQLEIWIRYNPVKWRGGLCIPKAEELSLNKRAVYILCGPLVSLAVAVVAAWLAFMFDMHGAAKLICVVALCSTIFDFFVNLTPFQIKTADGAVLFSDGYLLFNLQKLKRFPEEYADAFEVYDRGEYARAGALFEDFISRGLVNEEVYRYGAMSYMLIKDYGKSYSILKEFEAKYPLNTYEYYNLGMAAFFLKLNDESRLCYEKSLALDPGNPYALNAIGYEHNTKCEFEQAILLFDKAIESQSDFAYAFNNRGHAKIETGQLEEGLKDIQYSLQLDDKNSYVYRNLGIYHLKLNENKLALEYFLQSQQMDKDTDLIDELINKALAAVSLSSIRRSQD